MKVLLKGVVVSAVLFAGAAAAQNQYLDLSGRFRCVVNCLGGQPNTFAYITQSGLEMNIVNDAGMPSRAWMDRPGRFWVERANMGAVYSPDGATIQFDNGTVWQRDVGLPEPAVPAPRTTTRTRPPREAARPPARPTATNAYDGGWSVRIVTQAGPCDPEYRFGAQIANGSVVYDGGSAVNIQGQVVSDGRIWVNISAGGQNASGEGRLSESVGSGNWRGQGPGGSCAGVWQAVRRS